MGTDAWARILLLASLLGGIVDGVVGHTAGLGAQGGEADGGSGGLGEEGAEHGCGRI